jgi:CRP/FNR family transcriptional regulator, anaerobic regulatory protein
VVQKPEIFDDWLERNVADFRCANRTSVAHGQLDAQERIAWFILELRDRLNCNGAVNGDVIEFPLRQSHIADATGLTTVHVFRVINACRKQGIYAIEDGTLRILDLAALRRLGEVM